YRILETPSYGYSTPEGLLYKPSCSELFKEFFSRVNPFISKKNWLPFVGWFFTLSLSLPFFTFLFHYFSWKLLFLGLAYSMVGLGTFGTVWFHRYSTHRAFQFRND